MEQKIRKSMDIQLKSQHRKKIWKRIVAVLGGIVVFCTTYVLILPAITLSGTSYCGEAEHKHSDDCYVTDLLCKVSTEGHVHKDECYEKSDVQSCTLDESPGHVHTEACVKKEKLLSCELPESEGHEHTDTCYTENVTYICGMKESQGHTHDESCQKEEKTLVCGMEEAQNAAHKHNEDCYDSQLICELEEHTHELICFSNPKADLEKSKDWEKTLPDELTGEWREDVLSIAESQLGYEESDKNYIVEKDKKKGYTRYGEWYGDPYGHWCAMFVSFCLDYAEVEGIPLDGNCQHWIDTLSKEEYQLYHDVSEYTPQLGDLIFFDWDEIVSEKDRDSDHIGFVVELIPETEDEPAMVKTIEGNASDCVKYKTYEMDDSIILGYAELPEKKPYVLEKEGEDYIVTVSFGDEAEVPEDAKLVVEEIEKGTDEYEMYLQQAMETVAKENVEKSEISFARFFDIHFLVDGEELEPSAPVNVKIRYKEAVEIADKNGSDVVHFAEEGVEILEATTSGENTNAENKVDTFSFVQESFSVSGTVVYAARATSYDVWLDGTNGGLMNLQDSPNLYVSNNSEYMTGDTLTLPTEWESPRKYAYKLKGWYDIVNSLYYAPGEEVVITKDTVFYADWEAQTYDVGVDNEHDVASMDTNDFIRTDVFDYGVLFNVQSMNPASINISSSSHSETWTIRANQTVNYNSVAGIAGNNKALGVVFRDWNDQNKLSYPNNVSEYSNNNYSRVNYNQGTITQGVLDYSNNMSGQNLLDILFSTTNSYDVNTKSGIIGKRYLGQGNYFYQYMDRNSENYDGTHDGYYYYDSKLNAASYNLSQERFYIYDYLERTSDSLKDGENDADNGAYSDILPFNSPYANINIYQGEPQSLNYYTYNGISTNVQYDAKYNNQGIWGGTYNDVKNVGTNYFFGIKSQIRFYLPNNSGELENGEYGNQSIQGQHLAFEFAGDDDVWVYVDDQLVLDIGGMHGVQSGSIDFSTGVVKTDAASTTTGQSVNSTTKTMNFSEGEHTLTIYYVERGSSQSNCEIYFNIAPRYTLDITKQDTFNAQLLNGAEFSIYRDCTHTNCVEGLCDGTDGLMPAYLWDSYEEYASYENEEESKENSKNVFEVVNGKARCWGFTAGRTYYIKETAPPEAEGVGYLMDPNDVIVMKLSNSGDATYDVKIVDEEGDGITEGFDVIDFEVDEVTKTAYMVVTNQIDEEVTKLKVTKAWADNSSAHPDSVTVYLTVDGERVGREAVLSEKNNWTYMWVGLPKYDENGEAILYEVEEGSVPGYLPEISEPEPMTGGIGWIGASEFEDGETYMLVSDEGALAYRSGETFQWLKDVEAAKSNQAAQWTVESNGNGYKIVNVDSNKKFTYYPENIFSSANFYLTESTENTQAIRFENGHLFGGTTNYMFNDLNNSDKGAASTSTGTTFSLLQLTDIPAEDGMQITVTNKPMEEEDLTDVNVAKEWSDGAQIHEGESITVHLYADGKDTGRTVVLSGENDWIGVFDKLPYYQTDGETVIDYTIKEDPIDGYVGTYAEAEVGAWGLVNELSEGTFRFASREYALACDSSGNVVAVPENPDDRYQQWVVSDGYKLRNVGSNRYLRYNGTLNTVTSSSSASNWNLSNGYLSVYYDSRYYYLALDGEEISVTRYTSTATTFSVYKQATAQGHPSYKIVVTNTPKHGYELPETGGIGTTKYILGGVLLMMAATLIFIKKLLGRRLI